MELELTPAQVAILRGIGAGFGDSEWATPADDVSSDSTHLLTLRMIQQWDNQYIVTDLGREFLDNVDAAAR